MGDIDRRKHDIDVMERVLGGTPDETGLAMPHSEVVDLSVRPWLAGSSTSVVQVTVSSSPRPDDPGTARGGAEDHRDDYDDDRRGEHRYPDTDELDRERPSQRERDALKSRLEHLG